MRLGGHARGGDLARRAQGWWVRFPRRARKGLRIGRKDLRIGRNGLRIGRKQSRWLRLVRGRARRSRRLARRSWRLARCSRRLRGQPCRFPRKDTRNVRGISQAGPDLLRIRPPAGQAGAETRRMASAAPQGERGGEAHCQGGSRRSAATPHCLAPIPFLRRCAPGGVQVAGVQVLSRMLAHMPEVLVGMRRQRRPTASRDGSGGVCFANPTRVQFPSGTQTDRNTLRPRRPVPLGKLRDG